MGKPNETTTQKNHTVEYHIARLLSCSLAGSRAPRGAAPPHGASMAAESSAIAYREAHVASVLSARAIELKKGANNKRVLDEDSFVDALESIIRRDFYPDLPALDAHVC